MFSTETVNLAAQVTPPILSPGFSASLRKTYAVVKQVGDLLSMLKKYMSESATRFLLRISKYTC